MNRTLAVTLLILCTAACQRNEPSPQQKQQPTHQPPTATETFNLRSKCAELGEKILADNHIGAALTQSQTSHYDELSNRCFVELAVQSINLDDPNGVMDRTLFDGQTKDLLATTSHTKHSGIVFGHLEFTGFDKANEYIDNKMQDDQH